MARKVFITSDISSDEELSEVAEVDQVAALMWPWLLTFFDDWGRAKASPREIKNSVFQANDLITMEIIKKALQLYQPKLIRLYEADGKWYMCVDPAKWFKYQTHIRKEKRDNDSSKHPAPPDNDNAQPRAHAREDAYMREDLTNRADTAVEGSRDLAQTRANLTHCIPSPSLSPSLSLSKDISSGSSIGRDNPFGLFEKHEFGKLDDITKDFIGTSIDDYSEKWVIMAIKEAVKQNIKKWSYVDGTLKRWVKTNHPEPWTLEKETVVTPFQQKNQKTYKYQKPVLPIVQNGSETKQLTPEERAEMQKMIQKLGGSYTVEAN